MTAPSWLKKIGSVIGRVLGIVATEAKPVADEATKVLSAIEPQWAGLLQAGDNLVSKIAAQAIAAEGLAAAAGTATGTGVQKLETVLTAVGPDIDAWIQNAFPGAAMLDRAQKAGLVNAVVDILNKVKTAAATSPTPTPVASVSPSPVSPGPVPVPPTSKVSGQN